MIKQYKIRKVDLNSNFEFIWENTEAALIDCYLWTQNGYRPKAEAKMTYSQKSFHILLKAFEEKVRATYRCINDFVCKDSCLEFFFNPVPGMDNRYLNFEFNPLGTIYFSIGTGRQEREFLDKKDVTCLNISNKILESEWSVQFDLPFSLIEKYYDCVDYFGEKYSKQMKGNFYKCGDDTEKPHYGCWSPIVNSFPDFHRPEFFGDLILI